MPLAHRSRDSFRRSHAIGPLLIAVAAWVTSGGARPPRPLMAQAVRAPAAVPSAVVTSAVVTSAVVSGAVRDSVSGRLISGAAVMLRDSLDQTVGYGVSDERGLFRVAGPSTARTLRVQHIGFRPTDVSLVAGGPPREIALAAVPPLLAPVRVSSAARCPKQSNNPAALGFLGQVRAGLLATVIAGAQQPRTLAVLSFAREYAPGEGDRDATGGDGSRIARQSVRLRTEGTIGTPFGTSRTGAAFVADGFRQDSSGASRYYAPDASTLVDDDFAAGYCFRVIASDASRPNQVGLGFAAPKHRDGRIDVDGVLWVDTVAQTVRDLTFQYVGLPPRVTALHPGGQLTFREMPTGVAFIDRWSLRLVSGEVSGEEDSRQAAGGSSADGAPNYGARQRPTNLTVREIGGELARVTWPDGRVWQAPLGSWRLHLTDRQGRPAAGAVVSVAETDYTGTADSTGVIELVNVLPGPYTASIVDPSLAALGAGRAVEQRIVAARDSTVDSRVTVEMAERVVARIRTPTSPSPGVDVLQRSRDSLSMARHDGRSVESLLTGRFPGVVVTLAGDGSLQIRIRGGATSFVGGEEPLYVVDGTPLSQGSGGITFLNPNDIEKIEVLKNAQDVGIYGVRGANGVIRITTTRPGRR